MRPVDVAVIGGGPAGAAAAIRLARAGVRVALIERARHAHDKVCGEFVGGAALAELALLDIDIAAAGARPLARLALAHGTRCAEIPLPFAAVALSRAVLDETLVSRAAATGAELRRGAAVRAIARDGTHYVIRLDGGAQMVARDVFIATGKHDLAGHRRAGAAQADWIGFKQHVALGRTAHAELAGRVAIVALAGGYLGLQPLDGARATLCLALSRPAFAAAGGTWPALLDRLRRDQPRLDGWLAAARPDAARPLAIGRIPYGFVRRATEGAWWLGDQAAVIPSFAGAGIGLALTSAHRAADAFLAGGDALAFQRRFAAAVRPRVVAARVLARALVHPAAAECAIFLADLAPRMTRSLAGALQPAS